MIKKYGCKNPMQNEELKKKAHATNLEKYGNICPLHDPQIHQNVLAQWKEKYGVDHPHQSDIIKKKRRDTLLQQYGVVWGTQIHYPDYLKPATYDDEYLKSLIEGVEDYIQLVEQYGEIDAKIINAMLDRLDLRFKPKQMAGMSIGEKAVEFILKNKQVEYIREYKFTDLLDAAPLRFDFAIFKGSTINALIEFQGRQHYEIVEAFGGEEYYQIQQLHDQMKRDYCAANNIPLIEIPYWEEPRIEEFLTEELQKIGIL